VAEESGALSFKNIVREIVDGKGNSHCLARRPVFIDGGISYPGIQGLSAIELRVS